MKIAVIFPGYGSQYVGMGKELYDAHRIVQEYFEEASNCLNQNFVKLCFASSDAELSKMNNAYTSLFLTSCAIFALIKELGVKADVVAGYNQGEYAALFAAGGISFPDGLYLLTKYATFYQEALEDMEVNAVRVTGVPTEPLEDICLKSIRAGNRPAIAIYETILSHIVTGGAEAIEQVRDLVIQLSDADVDHVPVEVGLHSALMDPVLNNFKIYLEKVDCKDLTLPFISSVNGQIITQAHEVKDHIVQYINSALLWNRIVNELSVYDLIIEVGPGTHLSKMLLQKYPDKEIISINKSEDIKKLELIIKPESQS